MTFKLQFDTDNAAFEGDNINRETASTLRRVAEHIELYGCPDKFKSILDINGNRIGQFALKED